MTNKPWKEEIYIKSQNEDYANELIKMVSELSKEQYTAGYKAGREDCINRIKTIWNDSHYMIPQDVLLEELQNLINERSENHLEK